jgi:hypothetical protein
MALKIHVTKIEAAEEGGLYGDLNIPAHDATTTTASVATSTAQ